MRRTVVPWRTPEQFQKVYEYLYREDISSKCWAVEQIGVWETRCWPSLPSAVEASLLLVRAKIQDMLFEADNSLCSAHEIEMMYATSIIRFVNLLIELDQNTVGKIPMASLAKERDIPTWIVDIRHNVTHGHFPTLAVLRMGYSTVMGYLERTFWAPESTRVCSIVKTIDETEKDIKNLIKEYRYCLHDVMEDRSKKEKVHHKAVKPLMPRIDFYVSKPLARRKFLEIVVHPDICVTEEDINKGAIFDKPFVNDEDLGEDTTLPIALQRFWNPMLEALHKYDAISQFLEMLLLSQEHRKIRIFQKVVDFLVLYVVGLTTHNSSAPNSSLKAFFREKGPILDYKKLIYACMKGCSFYSLHVFQKLTSNIKLGNWKRELSVMMSIRNGHMLKSQNEQQPAVKKKDFEITFTVDDVEEDIQSEMVRRGIVSATNSNPWSVVPSAMNFSNELFGHVHNPVVKKRKREEVVVQATQPMVPDDFTGIDETVNEANPITQEYKLGNFIFQDLSSVPFNMVYKKRQK